MPTLTVDKSEAGQRLDRYLKKALPGMPAGHLHKLLRTRKVRLNGKRARREDRVRPGDEILIHMDQEQFSRDTRPRRDRPRATRMDFHPVFEDEHLLVVAKPPFLPVHPGAGHAGDSLIDQVHAYLEVDTGTRRAAGFRPALAHRLDRDTSGLVVVGKSVEVLQRLGAMFKQGAVRKLYLALARGVPRPRQGTWRFEVQRRDVPGSTRGRKPSRGRRDTAGTTRYRVASTRKLQPAARGKGKPEELSLLVLELATGRTHQIRSHLLQAGHPLAGDRRYGDRDFNRMLRERFGLDRQFLHAFRLVLDHPVTGKPCSWTDPYPPDLQPVARALRLGIPPD